MSFTCRDKECERKKHTLEGCYQDSIELKGCTQTAQSSAELVPGKLQVLEAMRDLLKHVSTDGVVCTQKIVEHICVIPIGGCRK